MKNVMLTNRAAVLVNELQDTGFEMSKCNISDAQSSIARLIEQGRDEETISPWTDDLLKVLYTLSEYNELINAIREPSDNCTGHYSFNE